MPLKKPSKYKKTQRSSKKNWSPEELSKLVLEAMMDAYDKSTATMRERMELLTSGLNIPGL
jgi:nucleoid-associated protein EbfC